MSSGIYRDAAPVTLGNVRLGAATMMYSAPARAYRRAASSRLLEAYGGQDDVQRGKMSTLSAVMREFLLM